MATPQLNFEQPMKIVSIEVNDFVTRIEAVPKGIIAMALQALGIGSKTHLQVDAEGARLKKSKMGSEEEVFIPFSHISASFYHRARPLWAFIVGVIVLLSGLGAINEPGGDEVAVIIMATSSLFFLLYLFGSQAVSLGIVADAGMVEQLKLSANKEELKRLKEVKARIDEMIIGDKPLI